ncbi:UxaA family hydrolase [Haloarcula nitratireducens]|uniref:UxaA family hydrolase n=1 Tax=Haloarcula nitratireducens TaxID=2487749 RepID=A0AAW4PHX4_9EURY|nr:UxaA family hydrolase [Halomicroarcula nitratireducens]MBX0297040.1 UxaA family hydrolase [Halomicroarcula nitratireducens]
MTLPETGGASSGEATDPLEATVDAYRRADGNVGVRNHVLVVPSVICSHIVAERIADATDGAVSVPHDHGCAQIGSDHEQTERTLLNIAQNPNVAGVTVVGLGCEHLQSGPFADRVADADVSVRETAIQDAGGSDACIKEGVEATGELAEEAAAVNATEASLSDLTVGVVSSDLAGSTREVADPLVGGTVEALLNAGACVAVAGTERFVPHTDAAIARAANDEVAAAMREAVERDTDQPGNVRGVVRTAAESPFEDVAGTWGEADIDEFVPYGGRPSVDQGLVVVDAPSRFEEAATALAAAGASIVIHVTAEGVPTGHPVVPVLKITGEGSTAAVLADDIDVDARSATPRDLLAKLRRAADGESTAAERHGLTKFAINRVGPSL